MTKDVSIQRGKKPADSDVQALFDAGYSRNRIAAQLEVSTRAVDEAAARLGIKFNTELTRDAVKARVSRANEQRIEIGEKLRRIAALELDGLTDGLLDAQDRKSAMTTAAIAVQRDLELQRYLDERFPDDGGRAQAISKLDELISSVRASVAGEDNSGSD